MQGIGLAPITVPKLGATAYRYRLVTRNSSDQTVLASAGSLVVGHLQQAAPDDTYASGEQIPAEACVGTAKLTADGSSFAKGDLFKAGANGKITAEATPGTKTVDTLGIVNEVSTTDGDVIEVTFGH